MEIKRVDHYTIRTHDLEAARRFYTEVIGLKEGPRPPFDFPGFWLYGGEPPSSLQTGPANYSNYGLVHLMGFDKDNPGATDAYVGARAELRKDMGTGPLDHVAFAATGRAAMIERCRRNKVDFLERAVPGLGLHQMFIKDPDGVTIELNYPAAE